MKKFRISFFNFAGVFIIFIFGATFDTSYSQEIAAHIKSTSCDDIPKVIDTLDFEPHYIPGTESVNKEGEKFNQIKMRNLNLFMDVVSRYSDNPTNNNVLCLERILLEWASKDGMMFAATDQAQIERQWSLSGIGLALMKLKPMAYKYNPEIKSWLFKLLDQMEDYHATKNIKNNHAAWAALAAGSISYVFGSEKHWVWAVKNYNMVVSQIQDTGTLPLELRRGARASSYHLFAALPLTILRGIMLCRNVSLSGEEKVEKLKRLISNMKENKQFLSKFNNTNQFEIDDNHFYFVLNHMSDKDSFYTAIGGSTIKLRNYLDSCLIR